ncbi:hypothetical protein EW145_g4708 [Phellinidium pouzarii]|uniref:Survival protein SurE-like phosphatase/nucleotidase domain-containing protein n=1 Tax=Phellinidium pouzarii TaxID=167371 RepID=A0A4S4L2Q6_9AGAM|nr:hypothetical protein EW145_g4708 [Phellinidium pouzarii]
MPVFVFFRILVSLAAIVGANSQIKIVHTNDDGWAVANVRAQDTALVNAGFNVVLSSPAENESGTGSSDAPATTLGPSGCEFESCPPFAPATGSEPDNRKCYNLSISAPTLTAKPFSSSQLRELIPCDLGPDFVVSGPNVGNNLGPDINGSGTVGAACEAAIEGFPSVALSGAGGSQVSFTTLNTSSASTTTAEVFAAIGTTFTQALLAAPFNASSPILPPNITLNVNYPDASGSCTDPDAFSFVLTRLAPATASTPPDVTTCGTDRLPVENSVVALPGCFASVSVIHAPSKSDVDAATQAFVLNRLSSLLPSVLRLSSSSISLTGHRADNFADAQCSIMSTTNSSPTALSPNDERLDSFEFPPSLSPSSPSAKKGGRQSAFYPNMNSSNKLQKPFSRSAAKRESVMALGSIEHLQHYFTKTGIAAKQNELKQNKGFVPAIGGPASRPRKPSLGSIQEFHLPPSPAVPVFSRPPYPSIEKTYEIDPENLKPGVIRDLEAVSESWGLAKSRPNEEFDVLSTLKLTTQLIRSVRNYVVSLPDDSVSSLPEKPHFRPSSLQPIPVKRLVSNPSAAIDPLSRIRRSAVEVLTVLRALEETARLPLSDDAYDAQSDHLSSLDSRSPEPDHPVVDSDEHEQHLSRSPAQGHDVSFAISVVSFPGRSEAVRVWDDEDDDFESVDAGDEKREVWDDRLVLGGGWLYRQDIHLVDLKTEREVVGKYLDAVDEVLFEGPDTNGLRGWERASAERMKAEKDSKSKARRRSLGKQRSEMSPDRGKSIVSTGLLDAIITEETDSPEQSEAEDSVDDDDLPEWAKREAFTEEPLARAHAIIAALVPVSLLSLLPTPYTSRIELLSALSSGQLLCIAYNTGVMADDSDKDAAEKRKIGWTFRRTDNLRLWAAALKLRYLVPLTTPMSSTPSVPSLQQSSSSSSDSLASTAKPITPTSSSPARIKFIAGTGEVPLIVFDAKAIARRDEGWDAMLETVVLCWVRAVVNEKRAGCEYKFNKTDDASDHHTALSPLKQALRTMGSCTSCIRGVSDWFVRALTGILDGVGLVHSVTRCSMVASAAVVAVSGGLQERIAPRIPEAPTSPIFLSIPHRLSPSDY